MQAHYADEIPLSVLKREQDRIIAELDQVTRPIDAHFGDYADARAHLDDALGLLTNCADGAHRFSPELLGELPRVAGLG